MTLVLGVGLAGLLGACSLATAVDRELIQEEAVTGVARGSLGGYQNGRVWGWAEITGQEAPVSVRIEVDGAVAATVTADDMREDLVTKGLHPTGNAGFDTDIGDQDSGAVIRAFIVSTDTELMDSPVTVP